MLDHLEIECVHHHPDNTTCGCCRCNMTEIGSTIVREEPKFIPAKMVKVQHIENAFECKACKQDISLPAQMKRGQAPQPAIHS